MPRIKIEGYSSLYSHTNVDLFIGKGSGFNGMEIQNDGEKKCPSRAIVAIGNHVRTGHRCMIRTSDHDFKKGYPMVHGSLAGYAVGNVSIGDYTWIGDDVLIMKGVNIGRGVIIQARSVVVSDIPSYTIAGGHPARVFSNRDPDEVEGFFKLNIEKVNQSNYHEKLDKLEYFLQNLKNPTSAANTPHSNQQIDTSHLNKIEQQISSNNSIKVKRYTIQLKQFLFTLFKSKK